MICNDTVGYSEVTEYNNHGMINLCMISKATQVSVWALRQVLTIVYPG